MRKILDLGKLKVGIEASTAEAEKQLEGFGSKLGGIGSGVAKVGGTMAKGFVAGTTAMVAGATAVIAGSTALVNSQANVADEIDKASRRAGMSAEEYQKLNYAFGQSGVSAEKLEATAIKNQKALNEAATGAGTASEAYKTLGVSINDSEGNLRSSQDVYSETIEKLAGMTDINERNRVANDLFGKSFGDLAPLLDAGSQGIADLKDRSVELGLVMGQDNVDAGVLFGDTMDDLGATMGAMKNNVAGALLPAFNEISSGALGVVSDMSTQLMPSFALLGEAFEGGKIDKAKMSQAITEIMNTVISVITEMLPIIMDVGLSVLMALIDVLIENLPKIIDTAIEIIMSLVTGLMKAIPKLIPAIFKALETIITTILKNLPEIVKMGVELLTSLLIGIADSIPDLIPVIIEAVLLIVEVLLDNLPLLVDAGIQIIVAVIEGLINALPSLMAKAPELITKFVSAIANSHSKIVSAGGEIISKVVSGIVGSIGMVLTKGGEIVGEVVKGISDKLYKMTSIGGDLITGLWNGMGGKVDWIIGKIKGFTSTVLGKIKSFFGIASPSKETTKFGKFLTEGLGIGIEDNADLAVAGVDSMASDVMNAFDKMNFEKDMSLSASFNGRRSAGLDSTNKETILKLAEPIVQMNVTFTGNPQENTKAVSSLEDMFRNVLTGSGVALAYR